MRAMLRANSSGSAELLFIGSDGALTVTPQSRFGAGPFTAFLGSDGLYPLLLQDASGGRIRHVDAVAQGSSRDARQQWGLTLLWSYWGITGDNQLFEFAAILLGGGRGAVGA